MTTEVETKLVFICGSALRGQPDHQNLGGATFLREAKTIPSYRLHSVQNGWHPGIYKVAQGGISIPGEVYQMTPDQFNALKDSEPPHMYPQAVELEDGGTAIAFLYPQELVEQYGWEDVSHYGSWIAYQKAIAS